MVSKKHTICIIILSTMLISPLVIGSDIEITKEEINSTISKLMDYPWPMQCYNLHHTSRSLYSTQYINDFEKWRYRTGGGVEGGIAIDNEGIIYFGDKAEKINALSPNGTLIWRNSTDMWITCCPTLSEDGTLYVGSWDHYLYAFNKSTGERKWRFNTKGIIGGSLAISDSGTIYFGTGWDSITGDRIWAINPDGTEKWQYKTGNDITSSPAIADDGTIYIGSMDNYLYAMNPNGTLKWKFKTEHYVKGPPSIADDGTIYIGSYDDYLYSLKPNGTMKWKCKVGYGTETNPSISEDGIIYVGGEKLYAIYPNGTKKWTFNLGADRKIEGSCPAISSDGTIFIGTHIGEVDGGEIIAINPDGTEKWRKKVIDQGWIESSPSIGKDGTVYIGSSPETGGYLHAFGPQESNSAPKTPTISGKKNGRPREEYWYKISAVDPENNPIRFYIEWGDGTSTGWTREHASREDYYYPHTWSKSGTFMIRVKAKDNSGEESPWGYLEVNIPRNRATINVMWYQWFLERFPKLERLLNILY